MSQRRAGAAFRCFLGSLFLFTASCATLPNGGTLNSDQQGALLQAGGSALPEPRGSSSGLWKERDKAKQYRFIAFNILAAAGGLAALSFLDPKVPREVPLIGLGGVLVGLGGMIWNVNY